LPITEEVEYWHSANNFCNQFNNGEGRLVALHSEDELVQLLNIFKAKGNGNSAVEYWIGISESSSSAQWAWADETLQDFSNWGKHEPNNDYGLKQCGKIISNTGMWFATECTWKLPFACQYTPGKPAGPTPPPARV